MRVGYLILAHNRPRQLARLVAALPTDSPILIHFDKRSPGFVEARDCLLTANSSVRFVRRHRCWWGSPGIMWGIVELIRALVRSGQEFDYATLLSGQDYPIKSHDAIANDLARGGEFIECFSMLQPNRWTGQGPYFGAPDRVLGRFVRFRSHVRRFGARQMPDGRIPYGGSQWWTLSRAALAHISGVDERLLRFLSRSFIPDESFIQTILGNSPFRDTVVQDDLRLAIWDRPNPPYPATLMSADLPLIRSSRKHFARKFDFESDSGVADRLDALRGSG